MKRLLIGKFWILPKSPSVKSNQVRPWSIVGRPWQTAVGPPGPQRWAWCRASYYAGPPSHGGQCWHLRMGCCTGKSHSHRPFYSSWFCSSSQLLLIWTFSSLGGPWRRRSSRRRRSAKLGRGCRWRCWGSSTVWSGSIWGEGRRCRRGHQTAFSNCFGSYQCVVLYLSIYQSTCLSLNLSISQYVNMSIC